MYSTSCVIDAVLSNHMLSEQWLEFASLLEEAGDEDAALALLEATEYEEWMLTWMNTLTYEEMRKLSLARLSLARYGY